MQGVRAQGLAHLPEKLSGHVVMPLRSCTRVTCCMLAQRHVCLLVRGLCNVCMQTLLQQWQCGERVVSPRSHCCREVAPSGACPCPAAWLPAAVYVASASRWGVSVRAHMHGPATWSDSLQPHVEELFDCTTRTSQSTCQHHCMFVASVRVSGLMCSLRNSNEGWHALSGLHSLTCVTHMCNTAHVTPCTAVAQAAWDNS